MCILFIYNGANEIESDYSLILLANRDEFYERPAQPMGPWTEDSNIYGVCKASQTKAKAFLGCPTKDTLFSVGTGRDLQPGSGCGSWMAINPISKKLGLLLNLPGVNSENAKSRGKIVADFVKSDYNMNEFVTNITSYVKECSYFLFVTVEYGNSAPVVKSYSNATDVVDQWTETYLGFGNSLPNDPLKKVEVGKKYLKSIPPKYKKIYSKSKLIDELIKLLKTTESHLPDPQLETRQPNIYKELSSIFVKIPEAKYGTRAHTIVLITKTGHVDLIEISMQSPINVEAPHWERKEFSFCT